MQLPAAYTNPDVVGYMPMPMSFHYRSLTYNGRAARMNRPQATVTYFVPCPDKHNSWYNRGGQYRSYTGTVKKVDCSAILIDDKTIFLDDIAGIR